MIASRTEAEVDDAIKKIVTRWFYSAPILYKTVCKNPITKNKWIDCAARSGKSRIEYNPNLLLESTNGEINSVITLELSRILLRHSSKRRPEPFDPEVAIEASNLAILQRPLGDLPPKESFEFYYKALWEKKHKEDEQEDEEDNSNEGKCSVPGNKDECNLEDDDSETENNEKSEDREEEQNQQGQSGQGQSGGDGQNGVAQQGDGQEGNGQKVSNQKVAGQQGDENKSAGSSKAFQDATELWNDGDLFEELQKENEIRKDFCDEKEVSQSLGLLPGNLTGYLKSMLQINKPKLNDKIKVAKIFMGSAADGNKRVSTRSKPNRRTGFVQMGAKRTRDRIKLFCVIDVSASVKDEWVMKYVSYVNFIYKKYKPEIDLIEADTDLKMDTLMEVKSYIKYFPVEGRGGTDFQCVFDYLATQKGKLKYDGVILFTDGYVRKPDIPKKIRIPVLWALSKRSKWFEETFHGEKYVVYLD